MADWGFYGRTQALADLARIVSSGHWFFCRIEGRRRIGKTTLLGQLAKQSDLGPKLIYTQVPDSDERDVATTFRRSLMECERADARALAPAVTDFASMSAAISKLCAAGAVVVLDEFQYFTRSTLRPFSSFLQAEVDKLRTAGLKEGGLFVLGSLQSEMNALLEDKAAPLYGRITARITLDHWDFEDLLSVFRSQGALNPSQWLTLWTFFEGVPKFYHDGFEQGLYSVPEIELPAALLTKMFIRSSSPLSEEADTWFLRELRGRAVSILRYLADHPGCSHAELVAALNDPHDKTPLGTHLARLVSGYAMVDKLHPVFSDEKNRNARYYITDNFLKSWLAVAKPAREAARLKPIGKALEPALRRLESLEGFAFEKLIKHLHIETSKKGKGDFELSQLQLGYWNRPRNHANSIEIDLVAVDENNKRVRFGSCKRSAASHDADALKKFEETINVFLNVGTNQPLRKWNIEKILFSPTIDPTTRRNLAERGYRSMDLNDYAALFP